MSQQQLADAAKVAKRTIVEFERGKSMPYDRTLRDMVQTLEARGIEFLFEGSVGIGIRTTRGGVGQTLNGDVKP